MAKSFKLVNHPKLSKLGPFFKIVDPCNSRITYREGANFDPVLLSTDRYAKGGLYFAAKDILGGS